MADMAKLVDSLTMKEAGRKFRAFLICVGAATAALVAATQVPALVAIMPAYLTAIGGFLTVYLTGNVAHHHVTLRNNKDGSSLEIDPVAPPDKEPNS